MKFDIVAQSSKPHTPFRVELKFVNGDVLRLHCNGGIAAARALRDELKIVFLAEVIPYDKVQREITLAGAETLAKAKVD